MVVYWFWGFYVYLQVSCTLLTWLFPLYLSYQLYGIGSKCFIVVSNTLLIKPTCNCNKTDNLWQATFLFICDHLSYSSTNNHLFMTKQPKALLVSVNLKLFCSNLSNHLDHQKCWHLYLLSDYELQTY